MDERDEMLLNLSEHSILLARRLGEVSAQAAFEQIYELYSPAVRSWLSLSAGRQHADDLFQDIWTVFYHRWRTWRSYPEADAPTGKPIQSFLYRTFQFVLKGHRRKTARLHESLDVVDPGSGSETEENLMRQVEFGRYLEMARQLCPPEELDVLLAKLVGLPAAEIARTQSISEAVVDHRFRNAIRRLREKKKHG